MTIRILEQFVEGKIAGRLCEDMVVVTDDFAAVIDGASDATGAQFNGKAGGRFAAEVVAAAVTQLPAGADAREFADHLAAALAAAIAATVGELGADVRWPVAILTCASAYRREVWRIGDGNVVIAGIHHKHIRRLSDVTNGFRAASNAALLAKGMPLHELLENDPGARAARFLVDNQQHLANVVGPWGHGCINGQRVRDEHIEVFPVAPGETEVIMTSDGYPVVLPTWHESDAELQRMIRDDPAAIGELWQIGKSMKPGANAPDDRAYLRFTI